MLRQRYRDPDLDLSDVAGAVGSSPRQLQRVFREVADADFRGVLLELRMRRARRLLERGATVRATAPRVGYRGPSGLVAAYRRHWGVPPSVHQPAHRPYTGNLDEPDEPPPLDYL